MGSFGNVSPSNLDKTDENKCKKKKVFLEVFLEKCGEEISQMFSAAD